MPHIKVTMLPGRSPGQKTSLARQLRETLAASLNIDAMIVSVSVEDLPWEGWSEFLRGLPEDSIIIPENNHKEDEKGEKCSCHCC